MPLLKCLGIACKLFSLSLSSTKSIFRSSTTAAAAAAAFCLQAKSVNVASSKFHTPMVLLIDFALKLIIRASRAAQILTSSAKNVWNFVHES
jgi:hypothetical protein